MGSLWGEYVFIGSSDNARSNCTALKKLHGAFYFHEPPSGPAFGTRDAYATNLINSNDFFVVCQTHEDITLLLAADYSIDGAVETPCFPILGGENVRQIVIAESVGCELDVKSFLGWRSSSPRSSAPQCPRLSAACTDLFIGIQSRSSVGSMKNSGLIMPCCSATCEADFAIATKRVSL